MTALRLEAGSLGFAPARHDLAETVRSAARSVDVGAHPLRVDAQEAIEASFDPKHLTTLVQQVVRNAASFSPPEGPIELTLRRDGGDAILEVGDRGPGIPEDRRAEVFERFTTWRPPGYEAVDGPGLGLFIVRALVEEHGGSISIDDGPEGGTMLAVRLPLEGARGTTGDDAADL